MVPISKAYRRLLAETGFSSFSEYAFKESKMEKFSSDDVAMFNEMFEILSQNNWFGTKGRKKFLNLLIKVGEAASCRVSEANVSYVANVVARLK
jgi:hypothetical protein